MRFLLICIIFGIILAILLLLFLTDDSHESFSKLCEPPVPPKTVNSEAKKIGIDLSTCSRRSRRDRQLAPKPNDPLNEQRLSGMLLVGTVFYYDGNPAGRARVWYRPSTSFPWAQVRTFDDGRFIITTTTRLLHQLRCSSMLELAIDVPETEVSVTPPQREIKLYLPRTEPTVVCVENWPRQREPGDWALVYRQRTDGSVWMKSIPIDKRGIISITDLRYTHVYSLLIGPVDRAFIHATDIGPGEHRYLVLKKGREIRGTIVAPIQVTLENIELSLNFLPGYSYGIRIRTDLRFSVPCPAKGLWKLTATTFIGDVVYKGSVWAKSGDFVQLFLFSEDPKR